MVKTEEGRHSDEERRLRKEESRQFKEMVR